MTTIVPSTRGHDYDGQRFRQSLSLVEPLGEVIHHALSHLQGEEVYPREYNPGAFTDGPVNVDGERVLLLEDTWLTGATALSAAGALLREGAESVVVVPIARSAFENNCVETYRTKMAEEYDPEVWPRTLGQRVL